MANQSKFISNNEPNKLLSPKKDIVFQVLFGEIGSENITKEFLEAILKERITKINLDKNPILRSLTPTGKKGILDVLVEINGNEKCNIEMQVGKRDDIVQRILYYWSRTFIRDLDSGEEYSKLQRTIVILIADFEMSGLEKLEYFSNWKLIETKGRKTILTDLIEIDIIELPKIYKLKEPDMNSKLLDWICFLENPNSEAVNKIMESNKGIKAAREKLEDLSNDVIMQRLVEWQESAEHDEASLKLTARNEGKQEGIKSEKFGIAKKMKAK